jgi:outer membrane protein
VAKYHFGDGNSAFRPFVGAGVTYVWYDNVELTSNFQRTISSKYTMAPSAAPSPAPA